MSPAVHVLLIEDDQAFQIIHSKLLQISGFVSHVQVAHNGKEGLDIILDSVSRNDLPDLVFVDLDMPVMNGFLFLESLRGLNSDLRKRMIVAVLTSSSHQDDRLRATELGADCYFEKPLSIEELRVKLNNSSHPVVRYSS